MMGNEKRSESCKKQKKNFFVDDTFYKNVNKRISEGFISYFKISEETNIHTNSNKEFFTKLKKEPRERDKENANKIQILITKEENQKEQKFEFDSFQKFEIKSVKKNDHKDIKNSLDSLFNDKKKENKKVDLLSKSSILDFKLGLKAK